MADSEIVSDLVTIGAASFSDCDIVYVGDACCSLRTVCTLGAEI